MVEAKGGRPCSTVDGGAEGLEGTLIPFGAWVPLKMQLEGLACQLEIAEWRVVF